MQEGSFIASLPIQIKFDASVRQLARKIHDIIKQVEDKILARRAEIAYGPMSAGNIIESKFLVHSDYMDVVTEANAMIWGFLVIVIFSNSALIGVWPLIKEHSVGHYDRLRILGLQVWHFEACRIFDLFLVLFNVTFFVSLTWFLTGLQIEYFGVILIYYMFGIFGMTFGMLLAVIFGNEIFIFVCLASINSVAVILSGALWPQDALVKPYYVLAQFIPHTHVVEALQTYIFRQSCFVDDRVMRGLWGPGIGATVAYLLFLAIVTQRRLF